MAGNTTKMQEQPFNAPSARLTRFKFPANTNACNLLDKFVSQESICKEKKIKVIKSKTIALFSKTYADCISTVEKGRAAEPDSFDNYPDYYLLCARAIKKLQAEYTSRDVDIFIGQIPKLSNIPNISDLGYLTGMFISALINCSSKPRFTLHLDGLPFEVSMLAFNNSKNLTVYGDPEDAFAGCACGGAITLYGKAGALFAYDMAGGKVLVKGGASDCGEDMAGGRISIHGTVANNVGDRMKGGTILVKGDVLGDVGQIMAGGTIHVIGNVLGAVGDGMRGGTINVDGNIGSLGEFKGNCNILQRGKYLVMNGKLMSQPINK